MSGLETAVTVGELREILARCPVPDNYRIMMVTTDATGKRTAGYVQHVAAQNIARELELADWDRTAEIERKHVDPAYSGDTSWTRERSGR